MPDSYSNAQFGDFVLQNCLEQRATMTIYRAAQQSLKRFVQFKIISLRDVSTQPEEMTRELSRHILTVIGLEHMHLQPIYGCGIVDEDHVYVVGRFMSGSLAGMLEAGALPPPRALELAKQVALALAYIHAEGFIHSSLSPHNVYLDEEGDSFIDDLELSLLVQRADSQDKLKGLLDEPFYASVEQLELRELDVRSEVYSFGAILYHMLTGVPPFSDGDTSFEAVLERKCQNGLIPPRQLVPSLAPALEKAVLQMLRADPVERLLDMAAVQAAVWPQGEAPVQLTLVARIQAFIARYRPVT